MEVKTPSTKEECRTGTPSGDRIVFLFCVLCVLCLCFALLGCVVLPCLFVLSCSAYTAAHSTFIRRSSRRRRRRRRRLLHYKLAMLVVVIYQLVSSSSSSSCRSSSSSSCRVLRGRSRVASFVVALFRGFLRGCPLASFVVAFWLRSVRGLLQRDLELRLVDSSSSSSSSSRVVQKEVIFTQLRVAR